MSGRISGSGATAVSRAGLVAAIRAEVLKGRRAAPRKVALVAPLPLCLLGLLSSGAVPGLGGAGAVGFATYGWNYWYVLILPVSVALMAASVANLDARQALRPVLGLPVAPAHVWWAKVAYVLGLTFVANLVMLVASCVTSAVGGVAPYLSAAAACAVLLTLAVSWMIPVGLALTTRAGTLAGIAVPLLAQLVLGFAFASGGLWWVLPMSVAMRIATPLLGVAPSGIPLAPGDAMAALDTIWVLGLLVAIAAGVLLSVAGAAWFSRREAL